MSRPESDRRQHAQRVPVERRGTGFKTWRKSTINAAMWSYRHGLLSENTLGWLFKRLTHHRYRICRRCGSITSAARKECDYCHKQGRT